jgi:hypothetical protein
MTDCTYFTESILAWVLPTSFEYSLLRSVNTPEGSPLTDPNSLHLVNRGLLLWPGPCATKPNNIFLCKDTIPSSG